MINTKKFTQFFMTFFIGIALLMVVSIFSACDSPNESEQQNDIPQYTITYHLNEGENNSNNPSSYRPGDTFVFYYPTKYGYLFQGWYLENSFENRIDNIRPQDNTNLDLYAKWELKEVTVKYYLENHCIKTQKINLIDEYVIPDWVCGYYVERWASNDVNNSVYNGADKTAFNQARNGDITLRAENPTKVFEFETQNSKGIVKEYVGENFTTVKIPETMVTEGGSIYPVTSIKHSAFSNDNAYNITTLYIPQTINSIGATTPLVVSAFPRCYKLVEIINYSEALSENDWHNNLINSDVLTIVSGEDAENYISKIETEDNGVQYYVDNEDVIAVNYIGNSQIVALRNDCTKIHFMAFFDDNKSDLISVTIPKNVTQIDERAFNWCFNLVEVVNHSDIVITKDNGSLGAHAIKIANKAEAENYTSKIVTEENGMQYYVDGTDVIAFNYIGNSPKATFRADCTRIYDNTFFGIYHITSVIIPANVTEISGSPNNPAFNRDSLVEVINFSDLNIVKGDADNYGAVGRYAKVVVNKNDATNYVSKIVTEENGMQYYVDGEDVIAVLYQGTDGDLILRDDCTELNEYALSHCSITSLVIPTSVQAIHYTSAKDIETIYYCGNSTSWQSVSLDSDVTRERAAVYYYSETQPAEEGNYWHFDNNGQIIKW